ncbi:DISARM system phospholipase D-like protein DrmC [Sorangium sp. So ce341]|uniref:DISARM system phospholipase D-like protein DrmC n=1 Tax=Sorangium sp. So ce341 TaxID=3133302 RepID=UPI003F5EA1AB
MTVVVGRLSAATLDALADALERGVLVAPLGLLSVGRVVPATETADALRLLEQLQASGISDSGVSSTLRLAADARRAGDSRPAPSLVWSDLDIAGSRDTSVVCRELFRSAEKAVLLSTFSLGHKASESEEKGNPVLKPLAQRMHERPGLTVRLFVNLRRLVHMAHASEREVEDTFLVWFRREIWPWDTVPEVYYDPRSLSTSGEDSACLHAKCVVVDDARALVTSANLTEAAQARNIEAGVLLEDGMFARALRRQFESLIDRGLVRRLT